MQQSKLASAFIRFLIVVSLELALQEKPPIDNRRNLLELYIFYFQVIYHSTKVLLIPPQVQQMLQMPMQLMQFD